MTATEEPTGVVDDVKGVLILELVYREKPESQGSVDAFVPTYKNGEPVRRAPSARQPKGAIVVNITTDNKKLRAWRKAFGQAAQEALEGFGLRRWLDDDLQAYPVAECALTVELESHFARPQAHWGTGRNAHLLKDRAPASPIGLPPSSPPDVDKLLRAALDAFSGVVWKDDSQVTKATTEKLYAVPSVEHDEVKTVIRVWLNRAQRAEHLPLEARHRHVHGGEAEVTDQGTLAL